MFVEAMSFSRLLVIVAFSAWARTAGATITVTINQPQSGAAVGDSLAISASVSSPYQITSVQAQTGSVSGALSGSYSGTLDISSLPLGPTTLSVTATDTFGNTGSAQVMFAHDRPPSLTVVDPLPETVARPSFHVSASCAGAGSYPCNSLTLHQGSPSGTVVGSSTTGSLDQMETPSGLEGQKVNFYLVAADSAGLSTTSAAIPLYFDTSPRLIEVETVPGPIFDVDSTRIAYAMGIRTRGTTNDVVLPSQLGTDCHLSTNGVLCSGGEWSNGAIVTTWTVGGTNAFNGRVFAARGNYAIWEQNAPFSMTGYYRDSIAGTTTQVLNTFPNAISASDVAATGEAVFINFTSDTSQEQVFLYRGGVLTQLTNGYRHEFAFTDGVNVVYDRYYIGFTVVSTYLYNIASGTTVTLVPDPPPCFSDFILNDSHAVAGGWTAYAMPDNSCVVQLWVRAPDDTRTQVSIWSTGTSVDAINGAGEVMMLNTSSLGSYRYHASPGVLPDVVNSQLGHAIWLDNQWYIIMGRTLFSIGGSPPPDAGTDGSATPPDAGTTPDAPAPPPDAPRMPDAPMTMSDAATATPDAPAMTDAPATTPDALRPPDAASGNNNNASMDNGGCAIVAHTGPSSDGWALLLALFVIFGRPLRNARRRLLH